MNKSKYYFVVLSFSIIAVLVLILTFNTANTQENPFSSEVMATNEDFTYTSISDNTMLLSIELDDRVSSIDYLNIETFHQKIRVTYDDTLIYEYGYEKPMFGETTGFKNNLIKLSPDFKNEKLNIEITEIYPNLPRNNNNIQIATLDQIFMRIVKQSLFSFIISIFLITGGIVSFIVVTILSKRNAHANLNSYLSLFILNIGLWILFENTFTSVIMNNGYFLYIGGYLYIHIGFLSFLYCFKPFLLTYNKKLFNILSRVGVILITSNFILLILDIFHPLDSLLFLHFWGIMVALTISISVFRRYKNDKSTVPIDFIAFIPFVIGSLIEIISYYFGSANSIGHFLAVAVFVSAIVMLILSIRRIFNNLEKKAIDKTKEMYLTVDILTGCMNRYSYEKYIESLNKEKVNMAIFDLNDLKMVNDKQGHSEGDKYLKIFTKILSKQIKLDNIYRFGGDEFVVFFDDRQFETIDDLIFDIRLSCLEESLNFPFEVSFAVGYGSDNVSYSTFNEFFNGIDSLMYVNKNQIKEDNKYMEEFK